MNFKKRRLVTAAAILVCCAAMLCGCNKADTPSDTTATEAATTAAPATTEVVTTVAVTTEAVTTEAVTTEAVTTEAVTEEDVTTEAPATTDAPEEKNPNLFPDDYEIKYPDGFDYVEADLSGHVSLGQYKGMTVEYTEPEKITDTAVEEYILSLLISYGESVEVTDRAAQLGDTVVVDYSGSLNGEVFDGGTATNQTIEIGAGGYIDGFEEGIIGMQIGETKVVDCTFPDPYQNNPDLAGKVTQFEFTLHSISAPVIPELTDAFVSENFADRNLTTVAELEADVRKSLEAEREYNIANTKRTNILEAVSRTSTINSYPEGLVEDSIFSQLDYIKQYAAMYGMNYEDFVLSAIGQSAEEYEAAIRAEAETYVALEMTIFSIAKVENIVASDVQIATETAAYLTEAGHSDVAEFCTEMGITEEFFANYIEYNVIVNNVMEFLMENTTFIVAE